MLRADEIKSILSFDAESGVFTWASVSKYHSEKNRKVAGHESNGYWYIKIKSVRHKAHRLAWLYTYGHWPRGVIDHINGNGTDNRIANLRDVSHTINAQNHKERVKGNGLPTGVSFLGKKYRARITVNKKVIALGVFCSIQDAKDAYTKARKELHDTPVMGY